jgi:hypothetical protein
MARPRKRDYDQVVDRKWQVSKRGEYFEFICCDCSLTHGVELRADENGDVKWRMWRNDRSTKANRRRFKTTAAAIP